MATTITQKHLQIAIVAEVIVCVVAGIVETTLRSRLPTPLVEYLAGQEQVGWSALDIAVVVLWPAIGLATIISWIGLWRLWRSARRLYLYSLLAGLALAAFNPPVVLHATADALWDVGTLIAGLIAGIIYFSELRHAFEANDGI